ncbi:MAG: aldehyde reductase [Candidatus Neomarinimicrobiota bacterium]|nr:aldehyde reductase [Candidatus Neomarinimicrobiota bacterium]
MEKVLVTGGTGYIALHCIAELLKQGYNVRASLRSMDRQDEVEKAVSNQMKNDQTLEYCKLDLMKDAGWDEAVNGCDYILHLASPVYEKNMKEEDSFIEPARQGVLRALKPAIKYKIKRFVMTSSIAAITQGHYEAEVNEEFWSVLDDNTLPYIKSKTMAEKAMWEYINTLDEDKKIEACTINPSFVFGPSLSYDMGASNLLIRALIIGKLPAVANIQFNVVNVVDVAKAHVLALKSEHAPGQRFIVSEKPIWLVEIGKILKDNGFKKAPTRVVPNFLLGFLALFLKDIALFKDRLGKSQITKSDNAKNLLGWKPEFVEKAIIETAKKYKETRKL